MKTMIEEFYNNIDQRSYLLAQSVHNNILQYAKRENSTIVDRTIKNKVSQLLLSSTVPSVLLELGFLTHPYEKNLLQKDSYQNLLAQGIVEGVEEYFNKSYE